jgi:spermidine/putrescine transport system substrate-binding protein
MFFLGLSGLAGCRRETRPRLNVFNWSGYIGKTTIADFEREFGVRVRYSVYESNEEMLARVMSGNSGWDVAFPSCSKVYPMRDMGLLAPLDHSHLPNLKHLDIMFRDPPWDSGLRWGVPYAWGSTGICHSRSIEMEGWEDMWDADLQGRITMLDDPADVFAACLRKLGYSINSQDPQQLREAQAEAIAQKELVRAYINAEVRDQLVAGDVLAAQLWTVTAQQAIDESNNLSFCFPEEGFLMATDVAVVLRESKRGELAHTFLNYLLRPEVAAGVVVGARTASANGAARGLLPEDLRNNPVLYPDPETLARGEWSLACPPEGQRLRDRLWTEIKSA